MSNLGSNSLRSSIVVAGKDGHDVTTAKDVLWKL